jgi:DNA mismatch repair protein MutS2
MDPKSLILLEYHKVLARLKTFTRFEASMKLAEVLRPTANLEKALHLQAETSEARLLLSLNADLDFEGASDMRPLTDQAKHGITLEAAAFLAIRNTLTLSREAKRILEEHADKVPLLADLGADLSGGLGLVDQINRTITERGEVLDTASEDLNRIRSEMKVTHARLMERMTRYITDPQQSKMLQETLITQRNGRYVLPLRSEFKGRIKGLVHDQSASGATLFIEPLQVVEWNNRYRELELAERDEVLRVLHALSLRIAENSMALDATSNAMAKLDLIFAKGRYADELRASEPELVALDKNSAAQHPGSTIWLIQARHPLLDPDKAVPIDICLNPETFAVILTGPNTGGKTVTLKTLGLAVLMAQSGLHIPARSGSRLSVFKDVFADIGDEQSIEQSLSTFSGHIKQLVRILRKADARSLVLLDELGAGTDPQEGSALARAVLDALLERRISCMIATHYPELKAYAHSAEGVTNASLEFDLETLQPTYHLTIGLPGRSNALAIAERLGLDPAIIAAAKAELDPAELHAEDLLAEIYRQREQTRNAYIAADKAREEAELARNKVNARLEELEGNEAKILEKAQREAENELDALRSELSELRRQMVRLKAGSEAQAESDELEALLDRLATAYVGKTPKKPKKPRQYGQELPLKIGDKVLVRKLGTEGRVTAIQGEEMEVQVGALRMRLRSVEVERKGKEADKPGTDAAALEKKAVSGKTVLPSAGSPGLELDLRGYRVEDALDKLDDYLEACSLAGMPFGRIIHGKGTGAVRQAVRETLRQAPQVQRWESGGEKEGGDGVSVVFFN